MESLREFKKFCDEMLESNSRKYKMDLLETYKENNNVKFYLHYVYNPYITTGISSKKLNKKITSFQLETLSLTSVKDLLNYIQENNTGTDNTIGLITLMKMMWRDHDKATEEEFELLDRIICKDLTIGIDSLTINKVIPNLIPTFKVMLANKYFDNPTYVEGKEFALTTKIDGGRIIAMKKNGEARFYTRQGQLYEGLVDLKEEMEKYMPDGICLDGEITLLNPVVPAFDYVTGTETTKKLTSKEQYKETMKITRKDGVKHGVKMLVFDMMTVEEFENQMCVTPYSDRRAKLDYMFKGTDHYPYKYFVRLGVLYCGTDTSMINEFLNYAIENGEEGVMINITDAPYEFKRTNNLLKVKKMQDLDLTIIDVEEGTGQNAGKLGALLVDYKGFIVKVGSGISQELRETIWAHPEDYIGMTAVVQYFEETTNQDGGISLRFPVLIDIRTDK